jgi:hypothetical protein
MMGAAKVATDATVEITGLRNRPVPLPSVSTDPVDELVERFRRTDGRPVDALQVAATLESDGLTDRAAKVEYGYTDVFALADEVYQRLGRPATAGARAARTAPARWRQAARDVSHGVLYLLPGAVYPAVLLVLGGRSLVLGLVLGGGLGWVWAGLASWLAYQLLGRGHPGRAGQALRWSTVAGLPAAALLGLLLPHAGPGLVGLAVGQMAYQMASAVLMFYRQESWLLVTMAPALATGGVYLLVGSRALEWAIAFGISCVAATLLVALRRSMVPAKGEPPIRRALRGELHKAPLIILSGLLSAAFLLHAQARYAFGRLDIALGALPLLLGMGVVEWRARRFIEQARTILAEVGHPRQFVARTWLRLAAGVATCVGVVGAVALVLLAVLRQLGVLGPAAVAMTAAHVVLAGAYFLSFILAGQARYGWLCAALAVSGAVHGAGVLLASPALSPLADTTLFLGSTLLLVALLAVALVPTMGQVWRYR